MKKAVLLQILLALSFFCIAEDIHVPVFTAQEWHDGFVQHVYYTSDGKHILTSSGTEVKLWDVNTGLLIRTFDDIHYGIAVSPDGRHFFYRYDYYKENGDPLCHLLHSKGIEDGDETVFKDIESHAVAVSSDGNYLASVLFHEEVVFYDQATLKKRLSVPIDCQTNNEQFSTDSHYFFYQDADSETKDVTVINVRERKKEKTFSFGKKIKEFSVSPDGLHIAVIFWEKDQELLILSVLSGKIELSLPVEGYSEHIQFSPDGKSILFSSDSDSIELFDITAKKTLAKLSKRHSASITTMSFSPDGKHVAINYGSSLEIRRSLDGELIREIQNFSSEVRANRVPGKDLIWLHSSIGFPWQPSLLFNSNMELQPVSKEIIRYNFSSPSFFDRGLYFLEYIQAERKFSLVSYETETQKLRYLFPLKTGWYSELAVSSDGKTVACIDSDEYKLEVLDVGSQKSLFEWNAEDYCHNLIMSEDGRFLAFSMTGTSVVINRETGAIFRNGDIGLMESGAFSPDGKWYMNHEIGKWGVQIYATDSFETELLLKDTLYACFASDSNIIAAFTGHECAIFNLRERRFLRKFPAKSPFSAFFSADGKKLFCQSYGGRLDCYDVSSGKLIAVINADENGNFITYTPEGYFTGNDEGIEKFIHLVDGLNVFYLGQFYEILYRPDLVAQKLSGLEIAENPLPLLFTAGNAPEVSFGSVPVNSANREIEVSVVISDTGGGIGNVYFSHNGRVTQLSKGLKSKKGGRLIFSCKCVLDNGENVFQAYALNSSGKIESLHALASTTWNGITASPDLFVLAIGVNEYQYEGLQDLRYAVNDMNALSECFRKSPEGLYAKINIMKVSDEKATGTNISKAFDTLSTLIKPDDIFILFISGHGTASDGEYYFLPHDSSPQDGLAGCISKHFLIENLSKLQAKKTVIMLDTCNAGAFIQKKTLARGLERISERAAFERFVHTSGQTVITASADTQSALEGLGEHGIFTYCLLQALSGIADADGDGVSVRELANYIEENVPAIALISFGRMQTPWISFQGEDYTIILCGDTSPGESNDVEINPFAEFVNRHYVVYDGSSEE